MQVSVFSMFDGLTIDVPAITTAASRGWAVARPVLVKGASHSADFAIDAAAHLVHFSRLTIEAGRQHRASTVLSMPLCCDGSRATGDAGTGATRARGCL
jgi:hypothetical protein